MSEEKTNCDVRHVHFPEVRSFRISREDLARKLAEIDRVFEEIEKRRAEMQMLPVREEEEAED